MKGHYSEREAAKLTKTIEELLRLAILLGSCTDILSLRTSCLILLRKMLPSRPLILGCLFSTGQANLPFFMLLGLHTMLHQRFYGSIMDLKQMCGVLILQGKIDCDS